MRTDTQHALVTDGRSPWDRVSPHGPGARKVVNRGENGMAPSVPGVVPRGGWFVETPSRGKELS